MSISMSALLIDDDSERRGQLKAALQSVGRFQNIVNAPDPLASSLTSKSLNEHFVIFMSERYGEEVLTKVTNRLKDYEGYCGTGFIVLRESVPTAADVSKSYLNGIDGFLVRPYSVDNLTEVISICEELSKKKKAERAKKAVELLVSELTAQVTHVAALKKAGRKAAISQQVLRDMAGVLSELDVQYKDLYYDILLETLPNTPVPNSPEDEARSWKTYRGKSERARRSSGVCMINKVREELLTGS